MREANTPIRLSAAFLSRPQLFDHLSPLKGLCRDLLIWVALKNKATVKLSLRGFCRAFGYKPADLLSPCTPSEVAELKYSGIHGESTKIFSTNIGVTLARLLRHNLAFPELREESTGTTLHFTKLTEGIDIYTKRESGPEIKFKLGKELLADSRTTYHTFNLAEYLSVHLLGEAGEEGFASELDEAARKLFLHLSWKRQRWDYLERAHQLRQDSDPGKSDYVELLRVAGLANQEPAVAPAVGSQLRRILERVSGMSSIRMQLSMTSVEGGNEYDISWTRLLPERNVPVAQ
jgi:hypothetical protein